MAPMAPFINNIKLILLIIFAFLATAGVLSQGVQFPPPYTQGQKSPIIQQFIRGPGGTYGWTYLTVDGKTHYETKDANGVVRGRWTYYDPLGKKVAVNYIADADGFRVLQGFQPGAVDETPQFIQGGQLVL